MKSQYIFNADKAMLELLYKTITVYLRKIQFQLVKKKKKRKIQFLFTQVWKRSESGFSEDKTYFFTSGLKDQNWGSL